MSPVPSGEGCGMAIRPLRILSLCTGVGMLDLGVALALRAIGGIARTVAYVEREAYAAATLVARMEEASLGTAPVWDDLAGFDGGVWRGRVDCVLGGYPCQPFSIAGRRLGKDDPRHLWPHVLRIVEETRPALAFFENVVGHVRNGFEEVRGDLRRNGYTVQAGIFSSLASGASHVRERLFILAVANADGLGRRQQDDGGEPSGQSDSPGRDLGDPERAERRPPHPGWDGPLRGDAHHAEGPQSPDRTGSPGVAVGDPESVGRRQGRAESARWQRPALFAEPGLDVADPEDHHRRRELEAQGTRRGRPRSSGGGADLADADGDGREWPGLYAGSWRDGKGASGPAGTRAGLADADVAGLEGRRGLSTGGGAAESELARDRRAIYAPGPDDLDAWRAALEHDPHLAPALESSFYQLPHGLAPGLAQPIIPYRVDQLRCVGNGVDPSTAAEAFLTLLAACYGDETAW